MRFLRKSPCWWLWMVISLVFVISGCAAKQAVSEKPSLAAEKGMAELGRPSPPTGAQGVRPGEEIARPGAEKKLAEPGLERRMAKPAGEAPRLGVVEEIVKPRLGELARRPERMARPGEKRKGLEARRPEAITLARPAPKAVPSAEGAISPFKDIHFEFDKYNLRPDVKWVLNDIAKWLTTNPKTSVLIEGHADERGTDEYNLALGERRASSARYYLMNMGVREKRLSTISYGEFRPINPDRTEDAYAQNRRDHFIVKY